MIFLALPVSFVKGKDGETVPSIPDGSEWHGIEGDKPLGCTGAEKPQFLSVDSKI